MAAALVSGRSRYAPDPERLIEITPVADRARVAAVIGRTHDAVGKDGVRMLLADPLPEVRRSALEAAGALQMGLDQPVFIHLADAQPAARLAAVIAVLRTIGDTAASSTVGR